MSPPRGEDPAAIGPYRVLGRLGAGGMGRVHVARSPGGRLVAVKTLLAEGPVSDADRRRFAREVSLARRVGGVCTANVVDADPDAERPRLATEFIAAPALDELVSACGPLPPDAVPWVAAGAAEALLTLHDAGVVHRDVKPGNILLPPDGPRLIDFGISHAVDITRTTLTLGTIAYTSPEQARGEESTAASDVYSLGATLFHLATGRPPYRDTGDTLRLLAQVSRGDLDLAGLPPELAPLVTACLRDTPERRPGPAELLDELAPVVSARQGTSGGADWLPVPWLRLIRSYEAEGRALLEAHPPGPAPAPAARRSSGRAGDGSAPAERDGSSPPAGPDSTPTQDLRTRPVPAPDATRPYTRVRSAASSAPGGSAPPGDSGRPGAASARAGARERASGQDRTRGRNPAQGQGLTSGQGRASAGSPAGDRARAGTRPRPGRNDAHAPAAIPAAAPAPPQPPQPVQPARKKSSSAWWAVPLIVLFGLWWLNTQTDDAKSSGGSSLTTPSNAPSRPVSVYSPTPDPTEQAFTAVRAGDCLNAYGTGYVGQWSTEVPKRVDCDAADAFVRVTSTSEDWGFDCPNSAGRSYWSHHGGVSGHTVLCLERQFRIGQCVPAQGTDGGGIRLDLLRVWNCGADTVPSGYQYILQITGVHEGSNGRCPVSTRYWTSSVYGGQGYVCLVAV
ncbi:serine/threonine protein kinase [Streptomyces sp. NEAU-NA10]|uniref:serine/threonine protein kinase n=1 Tax=Streptomyces sp. NEAU-NA10 TaxID=3416050 RepID=UPI003CC517F4